MIFPFDAFIAALFVALLSLTGVFFFGRNGHVVGTHRFMIPIAIGVFLGIVFFELIPETLAAAGTLGSIAITIGFLAFYLLSHLLRAYHHHHGTAEPCRQQSSASLLLIGDAIHNVADGVVLVAAYSVNPTLGIATTIGIALHEIPQEIAEFSVLIRAGYTRVQAALYNLLSASSIIVGVVVSLVLIHTGDYLWILTGLAAGNLLYIAASDLIPEINGDEHRGHFGQIFLSTVIGLVAITTLITWSHETVMHDTHSHTYSATEHTEINHNAELREDDDHHDHLEGDDHHDH